MYCKWAWKDLNKSKEDLSWSDGTGDYAELTNRDMFFLQT